jgi:GNAT superfamily N-acetyltransferase
MKSTPKDLIMETIDISKDETDAQFIGEKINEYNFNRVPHYNHQVLNLIAREQNIIIGGLLGDTAWNWLYISLFWVDERKRSLGLGTRILEMAEELAVQRGCKRANLETHDFQNLAFYQKRGYLIFGQLDDFPEDHTKYYLWKNLTR